MDIVSSVVVYILLWWWVFFMTLPFGVKPPENATTGHATSAPQNPYLWRKIAASTVIAFVLFFIVRALILSGLFTFRPL